MFEDKDTTFNSDEDMQDKASNEELILKIVRGKEKRRSAAEKPPKVIPPLPKCQRMAAFTKRIREIQKKAEELETFRQEQAHLLDVNKYFKEEHTSIKSDVGEVAKPVKVGLAGRIRHSLLVMNSEIAEPKLIKMKTTREEQNTQFSRQVTYIEKAAKRVKAGDDGPHFDFLNFTGMKPAAARNP